MGKNLGTIDASAHFIVLEGARCQNASAFSESIPRTGKPFNNIRFGRSKRLTSCCALSYFLAIQRLGGYKRQANHVPAWSGKLTLLMSKAWLASSLPGRENSHRKRRGACHQICAS